MALSTEDQSNSPTQLVYIINSVHLGGAEVGMSRLLNGLSPAEYDIIVVTLDGYSEEAVQEIPSWVTLVDMSLSSNPRLSAIKTFCNSVRKADVIVGSLFHATLISRGVGMLNPDATVATWQHNNRFKNSRRQYLYGLTNRFTDIILADSASVATFLAEQFERSNDKIRTVPIGGIRPEEYDVVNHEGTSDLTVGTVGSLTEQKNHTAVLDVAAALRDHDLTFEIVGDGDLRNDLIRRRSREGLSNVTFHGSVTDVPQFLSTVDIYFQPSHYEGLCITVLEAMAAGLPIVGSDVGGIGNNVEDGQNGFLCEPNDVDGFASAILTLASDPELRARFGDSGRKIVTENHTQEILVSEFERSIKNISNNSG